jgi:hypothetical protein
MTSLWEVLPYRKTGKSFTRMPSGRTIWQIIKGNYSRNIELVLYLKCLLQFNFKTIEKKKLSLNQTIESYFPSVENAGKITIGNLLNHSGIYNFQRS